MKKLPLILAAVVVVVAGGAYYLYSGLDSYVKQLIESEGSAATHTKVTVNSVNISLKEAAGDLSYLEIYNPSGFSESTAIKLRSINVFLNKTALQEKGPLVINKIVVDDPIINYEVNAEGKNNIQSLSRTADEQEDKDKKEKKTSALKIIIEKVEINEGELTIKHSMLDKELKTRMPMVELRNIGLDQEGVNGTELTDQLLRAISREAVHTASLELVKELGPMKALKSGGFGELQGRLKDVLSGK